VQTKLTLRLEEALIVKAKRFSRRSGKSVSRMVSEYFEALDVPGEEPAEITPRVAALRGIIKGAEISETDYREYIEEKHI